jgi:hypothetical protein
MNRRGAALDPMGILGDHGRGEERGVERVRLAGEVGQEVARPVHPAPLAQLARPLADGLLLGAGQAVEDLAVRPLAELLQAADLGRQQTLSRLAEEPARSRP